MLQRHEQVRKAYVAGGRNGLFSAKLNGCYDLYERRQRRRISPPDFYGRPPKLGGATLLPDLKELGRDHLENVSAAWRDSQNTPRTRCAPRWRL